jgi:hypothetical protein
VYTYKFLKHYNVFSYNDTGMVPNHPNHFINALCDANGVHGVHGVGAQTGIGGTNLSQMSQSNLMALTPDGTHPPSYISMSQHSHIGQSASKPRKNVSLPISSGPPLGSNVDKKE